MEGTTNELVKLFRDRLRYPIITVYSILLIVYNWDVLAVFFLSDRNIEDRIDYINKTFEDPYLVRLWMPLIKAVIVSIMAPAVMWGLEYILKLINFKRQEIKDKRNQQILGGKLGLAKLEFQIEDEKSGKKSLEELNEKITTLENELKGERALLEETSEQLDKQNDEIAHLQEKLDAERGEKLNHAMYIINVVKEVNIELEGAYGKNVVTLLASFYNNYEEGFSLQELIDYMVKNLIPFSHDGATELSNMLVRLHLIKYIGMENYEFTKIGDLYFKYFERGQITTTIEKL